MHPYPPAVAAPCDLSQQSGATAAPADAASGRGNLHPWNNPAHWYSRSGVEKCRECEGAGAVWNGRGNGGNDPDSWDIDCDHCDAAGYHPCKVCGFPIAVEGYDCIACDTAFALPASELTDETRAELLKAVGEAFDAARAAESYVPAGPAA